MPLTLTVIAYKGLPPSTALSARFDHAGGSIGRSPENTLALPDPEKFISRKHAGIEFDQGMYRLIDASTAGTYFSREARLLQHETVELVDGDRLRIGEYELQAGIQAEEAAEAHDFFPDFPEPPMHPDFASSVPDNPFAFDEPAFPSPPVSSSPTSPFVPSFIEQPDASPFHESFTPPGIAASVPAMLPEFDVEDLLRDFENPHATPAPTTPVAPWPELPEEPLIAATPVSHAVPPSPPPEPDVAPEPFSIPTPGRVQAESPPFSPNSAPQPMPAHVAGVASADAELFRQFLRGAGIADPAFLPAEDRAAAMETLGRLFRNMVEGMMAVLRARSELKSQFRVSVTTMRPVNNNPLKFTVSVEDALKTLLARRHPGFIEPDAAVREGFDDIMNHQLAMTAGFQASLTEILKRFDPQKFERPYEEGIVFQKKAKCWDAYCKAYPEQVTQALENIFGEEFADVYEQQMRILRSARNKT